MKFRGQLPTDGQRHRYCAKCESEGVVDEVKDERKVYVCKMCKGVEERVIDLNPTRKWWRDENLEIWHESVGAFVFNDGGELLLMKRNIYPYGLTIPAGHVDAGEIDPKVVAERELFEETGLKNLVLELVTNEPMWGDKCRGGADVHLWHLYKTQISKTEDIVFDAHEAGGFEWHKPDEVAAADLTPPTRHWWEMFFRK